MHSHCTFVCGIPWKSGQRGCRDVVYFGKVCWGSRGSIHSPPSWSITLNSISFPFDKQRWVMTQERCSVRKLYHRLTQIYCCCGSHRGQTSPLRGSGTWLKMTFVQKNVSTCLWSNDTWQLFCSLVLTHPLSLFLLDDQSIRQSMKEQHIILNKQEEPQGAQWLVGCCQFTANTIYVNKTAAHHDSVFVRDHSGWSCVLSELENCSRVHHMTQPRIICTDYCVQTEWKELHGAGKQFNRVKPRLCVIFLLSEHVVVMVTVTHPPVTYRCATKKFKWIISPNHPKP